MLREYLYVDITRVRSLLAQLDKGVVEQAVESRTGTARGVLRRPSSVSVPSGPATIPTPCRNRARYMSSFIRCLRRSPTLRALSVTLRTTT